MKRIRVTLSIAIAMFYAALGACKDPGTANVRFPAVAGSFYSSNPDKLKQAIQQFLQDSKAFPIENPVAIVVPHAGYIYAGQIYADAYRQVMGRHYDIVVILGVNHTTGGFQGVSLGDYTAFRTPLGDAPVDEKVTAALLSACKDCTRDRVVHIGEHSIEVQIPFVQLLFPNARIVPAIIHPPDYEMSTRFGNALAKVLKGKRALIVISSDLSHYPDSKNAVKADRSTLEAIATLQPAKFASLMRDLNAPNLDTRACGEAAILAGMTAAKGLGATRGVVVGYANSGDVAVGDPSRTVGYGAVILAAGPAPGDAKVFSSVAPPSRASPLQDSEKRILLKLARETIRRYLATGTVPLVRNLPARMNFAQGAFVTLRKLGELRGCIGHIPPDFELGKIVANVSMLSAFEDRRFAPVRMDELEDIEIEISVLTPMKPIASAEEIVPGRDGVQISKAGRTAVFLPQVATEQNWDRTEMLENLCFKGALPSGCWRHEASLRTFQAEVFSESQFKQ
jgi:AmmeMemoRadiSam system protein B/AmmeMemoRadiSam system protein A